MRSVLLLCVVGNIRALCVGHNLCYCWNVPSFLHTKLYGRIGKQTDDYPDWSYRQCVINGRQLRFKGFWWRYQTNGNLDKWNLSWTRNCTWCNQSETEHIKFHHPTDWQAWYCSEWVIDGNVWTLQVHQ